MFIKTLENFRKLWKTLENFRKMTSRIKTKTCINLFKTLSNCNENGVSNIVDTNLFTNDYISLKLGNGGSWCRFDSKFGKTYKIITMKGNNKFKYSWEILEYEKKNLENEINEYCDENNILKKGNKILLIKMCGMQNKKHNRTIGNKIKNYFITNKLMKCVSCGTNNNLEIDHKNGLYNNPRVLDVKTQEIEDFQILCKHCNDQKRQTYVDMKNTGIRYPATEIPSLKYLNIKYISGDEKYEENDFNTMIGTYWYDPVEFLESAIKIKFKKLSL